MAPALLGWQMLWAFLQLSGDHHCFLWALLCLVLWSVLLITVCLRQKLPKLSLSLNFEMSCSNDGISSFSCMNGIGYGKVPEKKKNHVTKVYLLYILGMKQKAVRIGRFLIICQLWRYSFPGDIIIGCSPLLIWMVPLLLISTVIYFLVHKANFKSLLLLSPTPFMAFDTNSWYVETEKSMQIAQEQSNFFNNLSVQLGAGEDIW